MLTHFKFAVSRIDNNDQRIVQENLLCLGLGDTMLIDAFSCVARIPIEASYQPPVDHLYITSIYLLFNYSELQLH